MSFACELLAGTRVRRSMSRVTQLLPVEMCCTKSMHAQNVTANSWTFK